MRVFEEEAVGGTGVEAFALGLITILGPDDEDMVDSGCPLIES